MKQLIIVNGFPESGKDHFIDYSMSILPKTCLKLSTVDLVKKAATILGWDGEKTPVTRKFLSDLKDLSDEVFDTSFNYVLNQLVLPYNMFFVAVREPKNIQRLVDWANTQRFIIPTTILIRRTEVEKLFYSNQADADVLMYEYMLTLNNNSSINVFNNLICCFWKHYDPRT